MRACGVLLPIFGIPSNYGIGCFSKEAYAFVDQLVAAGQKYWQILPLGPTGYGDSPYQSFSTFAGNPYFIDLEVFIQRGLLREEECSGCDWGGSESYVDYEKVYLSRFGLLKKAFDRWEKNHEPEYGRFVNDNREWLEDYCLYMAIKDEQEGVSWNEWPGELKKREPQALQDARTRLSREIDFYRFQQYWFHKQWCWLKTYANNSGIKIVGDLPIYVAFDSADTWGSPELFQFDEENQPVAVAGCPPDGFSATGQLWGNPLYQWDYHKKTDYAWWVRRMRQCMDLYDIVRIDHFRGFDEYYAIPYGNKTAEHGEWERGPGLALFDVLNKEIPNLNVIAEDLGLLTDSVLKLVEDTGYPGMKVLHFAFGDGPQNPYLPYQYNKNCIVYTGTHDNETTKGWYESQSPEVLQFAKAYTGSEDRLIDNCVWDLIRAALSSTADMAVIPVQDYLCLGNEARTNTPSTLGDNWKWRLKKGQLSAATIAKMRDMAKVYGRIQEPR